MLEQIVNKTDAEIGHKILDFVTNKIKGIDGVVISDYAKGVITKNLMMNIINE